MGCGSMLLMCMLWQHKPRGLVGGTLIEQLREQVGLVQQQERSCVWCGDMLLNLSVRGCVKNRPQLLCADRICNCWLPTCPSHLLPPTTGGAAAGGVQHRHPRAGHR